MFGGIGMKEIVIVLLIALLLFGYRKLPEIGKALGQAISGFRKNISDGENSEKKDKDI
ncbi:MAG: twin-arginine translocase TatA/TatE family subunit [Desulfovibrionaceae bacterium]|nr:twin-arginine translocase TatA/TatE family subunit [Desulfovibrionaceae bacterium]